MATQRIQNIALSPAPSSAQTATVWYKPKALPDNPDNYNIVSASVIVLPNGDLSTPLDIPGLTLGAQYTLKAKVNCQNGYFLKDFTAGSAPNLIWIADQTACEKEGGLSVDKTISGMSSPFNSWFDSTTGRLYVADQDDANGNVMWCNPGTVSNYAGFTHSTAVNDNKLYNNVFDSVNRRIYFVGANTGGLLVYDIDSDSTSVVAFGTNGDFSRTTLLLTDTLIYVNSALGGSPSIIAINRTALTIASTTLISAIPSNTRFSESFGLVKIGSKMYVVSNNNSVGTIGVYNLNFTTNLANITLPSVATWTRGKYYQSGFYDPTSNKLYVSDAGSSRRFVLDPTGDTVVDNKQIVNKGGKSNVEMYWTVNPITNELYALHKARNSTVDNSPIVRTYVENRGTYDYANMYVNQFYLQLAIIDGTGKVSVVDPGTTFWVNPGGYGTDGSLKVLSSTVTGDNTGRKLTLTLKEVDANNGNAPTGQTKNNIVGDPDYIAPQSPSDCTVTYNLSCPANVLHSMNGTTEVYEFTLANSVAKNPAIAKVRIYAYDTNSSTVSGSPVVINYPLTNNYISGQFAGLATGGGQVWSIQIEYLNSSNVVLQTCNPS